MRILITGASGLVGRHLTGYLQSKGHETVALVRKTPKSESEIQWDAERGFPASEITKLENAGAVVHLAGAGIADERWTKERKRIIKESRVVGTGVLVEALSRLQNPPKSLISASAIGYYGNRGDEILTEDAPPGNDFLASVGVEWEREAQRAKQAGIRVVNLRIGLILSTEGGALKEMLRPFQMGVGGRVGSGRQFVSWIALEDILRVIEFSIENENLRDAVNSVAPNPVRNAEFAEALGHILHRPSLVPVPSFALKMMFGELADALLLASQRVVPKKLLEAGFSFRFDNIEEALRHLLVNK